MKKIFLLLPFGAVLAGCSSNSAAPVESAKSSELSPGVMQPVNGTGATNSSYNYDASVESAEMPSSMKNTTVTNTPSVSDTATQATTKVTTEAPKTVKKKVTKTVTKTKKVKEVVRKKVDVAEKEADITIPRDDNNKPIYSQIGKGSYDGNVYRVREGDTVFLVAYIAGKDVSEIAKLNNLQQPYSLKVGQKLKLAGPTYKEETITKEVKVPVQETVEVEEPVEEPVAKVTYTEGKNGTSYGSDGTVSGPVKASSSIAQASAVTAGSVVATTPSVSATTSTTAPVAVSSTSKPKVTVTTSTSKKTSPVKWSWPTSGRVVSRFSSSNKGIDIKGSKGQAIRSAGAGRVVYAGNALQGYGNLIIIKHNDDYLSAYAHNDEILVDEQDKVSAGEKIATMGSTGTRSTKLHFEIRQNGKSVDPMGYLPKR